MPTRSLFTVQIEWMSAYRSDPDLATEQFARISSSLLEAILAANSWRELVTSARPIAALLAASANTPTEKTKIATTVSMRV